MTQEEKDLLLKDLCTRLPYGVNGRVYAEVTDGEYDINGNMIFYDAPFIVTLDEINTSTEEIHVIAIGNEDTIDFIENQQTDGQPYTINEFKPYLRPISDMTEDEEKEYNKTLCVIRGHGSFCTIDSFDYLISHGFDVYDLIPKGLAIAVTKENNPYKK